MSAEGQRQWNQAAGGRVGHLDHVAAAEAQQHFTAGSGGSLGASEGPGQQVAGRGSSAGFLTGASSSAGSHTEPPVGQGIMGESTGQDLRPSSAANYEGRAAAGPSRSEVEGARIRAESTGALANTPSARPNRQPSLSQPPTKPRTQIQFPVIPVPQSLPNQTYQTPTQVQSILSLPPTLLLQFARTPIHSDQQAIAQRANATTYLTAMSLPPPSPTHLVQGFSNLHPIIPVAPITSIGDHPAIPLLLGQAFSPPTPGITVPFSTTTREFQPIYASVEDWSLKQAQDRVQTKTGSKEAPSAATSALSQSNRPHLNSTDVQKIAEQLKSWAIKEEANGIDRQVASSKETAVLLASQLSARSKIIANATRVVETSQAMSQGAPHPQNDTSSASIARAKALLQDGESGSEVEAVLQSIDLTAYAEPFKVQLAALASGYFAQLHREALNRLLTAEECATTSAPNSDLFSSMTNGTFPVSQAPSAAFNMEISGTSQGQAMLVRASASAALAANVMAAKEMAISAGSTLNRMGVDVSRLVPEQSTGGLASLDVAPEALARDREAVAPNSSAISSQQATSPSFLSNAVAVPSQIPRPTSVEAEVNRMLGEGPDGCTAEKRDHFLAYAHTLYASDPSNQYLLPVLHTIHKAHPQHLPTLLLMSCVYYSLGDLPASLYYNKQLLEYDDQYCEAMSNIGTTLRAMGKWREAEAWWWKAIKLRPTTQDATENLLGVLCNPSSNPAPFQPDATNEPPPTSPRFAEALVLCDYVDGQVFRQVVTTGADGSRGTSSSISSNEIPRPRILPVSIPSSHVHRLQNLFYAKGNLKLATHETLEAMDEFSKAIEVALSLPAWAKERAQVEQISYPLAGASLRDLVLVTTVIGTLLAFYNRSGGVPNAATLAEAHRLEAVDEKGQIRFDRIFAKVRLGGDAYLSKILKGESVLPMVLLHPEDLNRLLPMLFPDTRGLLPCLLESHLSGEEQKAQHRQSIQLTSQTTSTMLLTVAKILQDFMASPSAAIGITLDGIPISQSILLPLYYVALALHPSPSTCNNLGILLSTVNATTLVTPQPGAPPMVVNGQQLALKYYRAGLALDPKHPHLYTNLGSLLKDMGQLPQAVQMYRQAVEFNPTFDVALANLANAIKDTGHVQESIPFYRRAVEVNPEFPEAICGLVNALGGVCDWIGRGGVNEEWVVDNTGCIARSPPSQNGETVRQGYMGHISELVGKQLSEGQHYGAGTIASTGDARMWLAIISQAIFNLPPEDISGAAETWAFRINAFLGPQRPVANEGGFVIRLVERIMRRVQRRWYLSVYGDALFSPFAMPPIVVTQQDLVSYRRPLLPASLPVPPVPTVLPFHLFTYPVNARETRLISHRTGLRISHNTLTQPWLPPHVYPPPPPPAACKLNIGYVSSDLGNHPLSHLMQSVFGFHDLSKVNVFCYATSPSDKSPYRLKIEAEAQNFLDVSALGTQAIVDRIVADQIHILVNLSGYTKGARNEVFAARPAPVQMSYMGFAGSLSAGWCDYFVVDPIVCPPVLVSGNQWRLRQGHTGQTDGADDAEGDGPTDFEGDPDPEGPSNDFVYTEKLIYLPHSYFVTDHRQTWFEDDTPLAPGVVPIFNDKTPERVWAIEEDRRWTMRQAMFPEMRSDTVIFANWNQLYKVGQLDFHPPNTADPVSASSRIHFQIDPFIFRIWLTILTKHPNSVLWLLRFPAPGEKHLKDMATRWAGPEVASRVIFTAIIFEDVTNKNEHIRRGRIPDLFLDTTECNAHTTACDALAQGTPVLTWPRYMHKMCSRVATSVAVATGYGKQMVVRSEEEYEKRALALARSLTYDLLPAQPGSQPSSVESRAQRRGRGELSDLRKNLYLTRGASPLFDTRSSPSAKTTLPAQPTFSIIFPFFSPVLTTDSAVQHEIVSSSIGLIDSFRRMLPGSHSAPHAYPHIANR
ncbi:hypothetical protein P7C70_g5865, partial [Phenoliferia sp. Uapishka_3]